MSRSTPRWGWQLRTWALVLDRGSVAGLMATIAADTQVASRVLSRPGGERHLTDLRHIAGALHAQQRATRVGLVGLVDWLTEQVRRATESAREATMEVTRRLETDADAVQVLTVHTSKGLEFPIAYVPFGWDRAEGKKSRPVRCHDPSGRRVLDVRGDGATGRADLLAAQSTEDAGESLRLLYVALTRASSQVVVHWASSKQNTRTSPLHRVLHARQAGATVPEPGYPVTGPPVAGLTGSPWIAVEPVPPGVAPIRWAPVTAAQPDLGAAPFTRAVDTTWRRTSYSGLTAGVHGAEQAPPGFRDDEPDQVEQPTRGPEAPPRRQVAGTGPVSPFADLPAGAAFGTLVHSVLENVNTAAADLAGEVTTRCQEATGRSPDGRGERDRAGRRAAPDVAHPAGAAGRRPVPGRGRTR